MYSPNGYVTFNREHTVYTTQFKDGKQTKTEIHYNTLKNMLNLRLITIDDSTHVCVPTEVGRAELTRLYTKKAIQVAHESTIGSMHALLMAATMYDVKMDLNIRTHRKSIILGLVCQVRPGVLRTTSFGEFCMGMRASVRRGVPPVPTL